MSIGAAPAGVRPGDEAAASRGIREMFERVAPRYDLLNRLLSLRIDQYWRRVLARKLREQLAKPDLRWLDLCCGTGDVLIALEAKRQRLCRDGTSGAPRPGLASDFCRPMLKAAQQKFTQQDINAGIIEADALHFPVPDGSLDLITMAFGFRNLANYRAGLEEAYRMLAPGGTLAILEFSQPTTPVLGPLYNWYFTRILPWLGNTISGAGSAYSYLQNSVERFLTPEELSQLMRGVGFAEAMFTSLTGGVAVLHVGKRG